MSNDKDGSMWMYEARQLAAQCWCDPETSSTEMDATLCESVARRIAACMNIGAQHARNEEYWRNRTADAENRIAELEAKLADWERRSESCESKLGQLEANEKVIELEAKVRELEAERDAFYMNYRTRCDEETKHLETELTASRQQVERLVEALRLYDAFAKNTLGYDDSDYMVRTGSEALSAVEKERTASCDRSEPTPG